MADFTAGDVVVKTVDLYNYKGEKFDLSGLWGSIEIFEDILDHAITAKVFVLDAINLIERFPIIGQEKIVIKYSTPSFDDVKVELYSYDIPERAEKNTDVVGYFIDFMTIDGIRARSSFTTTPHKGNPVDAIRAILSEMDSTRKIDADVLTNQVHYIPPRQRPFEAINTICNRSFTSIAAESPDVLFFDTVDGYKIKSLYGLMQANVFAKYTIEDAAVKEEEMTAEKALFKVGNYTLTNSGSTLSRITGGSYGGTLGVFDVTRRTYTEKEYGITTSAENFSILNKNPGVDTTNPLIKNAAKSNYRYVLAGTKDHALLERTARLDQVFAGVRVIADLPGNSDLRVGHVLNLEQPSPDPELNGRPEKYASGKYLVASIRHVIVRNEINNYRTVVELVKDSVKLKL